LRCAGAPQQVRQLDAGDLAGCAPGRVRMPHHQWDLRSNFDFTGIPQDLRVLRIGWSAGRI